MRLKYKKLEQRLLESYIKGKKLCENPTTYINLPDGYYLIRGNKRGHCTIYYKVNDKWFLGYKSFYDSDPFNDFFKLPSLTEYERKYLLNAPIYFLNEEWANVACEYKLHLSRRRQKLISFKMRKYLK